MPKTEAWWVCSCGAKVCRPGFFFQEEFKKHEQVCPSRTASVVRIKQMPQGKSK